jgi:Flp pilus assembly protein TadD
MFNRTLSKEIVSAQPIILNSAHFILMKRSILFLLISSALISLSTGQVDKKQPTGGLVDKEKLGSLPPLTEEINSRATEAFAKKDLKTARKLYAEVVDFAPDNALAQANLGTVCFQMADYKEARVHLEKALEIQPTLPEARIALGITYFMLEQYYLAISTLSRAVHDTPKDATAHNYLAVALRHKGWIDGAEEELLEALRLDENYAEAHFNLALVYLERKTPALELARRHYYHAVELGTAPDKVIEKQLKAADM